MASKTANLYVRIEPDAKEEAERILSQTQSTCSTGRSSCIKESLSPCDCQKL